MPRVRVSIREDCFVNPDEIFLACRDLVPAAFHCEEGETGKLTPGTIVFELVQGIKAPYQGTAVLVEAEAYSYPERDRNVEKRAQSVRLLLGELFPDLSFSVWLKTVNGGWASDMSDAGFSGSMSMSAACGRARDNIELYRLKRKANEPDPLAAVLEAAHQAA